MDFLFRADHYLLHRVRSFCLDRGVDERRFIEEAIKEAILEFRRRGTMPENGYSRKWGWYRTRLRTEDPMILGVMKGTEELIIPREFRKFLRQSFDVAINRYLERKLCQAQEPRSP